MSDSSATPWTAVCQAPLSMEFSRQEYWNGLPFPTLRDLPDSKIKPVFPVAPALQMDSLSMNYQGSPHMCVCIGIFWGEKVPGFQLLKKVLDSQKGKKHCPEKSIISGPALLRC